MQNIAHGDLLAVYAYSAVDEFQVLEESAGNADVA